MIESLDKKAKGHNMIIKLEMMKAFDKVSWQFPFALLARFGFSDWFVSLIRNNLTNAWFSIFINGKSQGFFQAARGLKQGDPLSLFLFILVSKDLSRGLNSLLASGKPTLYALPRGCHPVTHLSFADDVMIFVEGIGGQ